MPSRCGNIGKVSRITCLVDGSFKTLAGFIDFLLPAISVGSAGAISPIPNIAPVSLLCGIVVSRLSIYHVYRILQWTFGAPHKT